MTVPHQRDHKREYVTKRIRAEKARDLVSEAELRRRNDLEVLAVQIGLSYSTVVDLLRSGWKYSEIPGLRPRWIKI